MQGVFALLGGHCPGCPVTAGRTRLQECAHLRHLGSSSRLWNVSRASRQSTLEKPPAGPAAEASQTVPENPTRGQGLFPGLLLEDDVDIITGAKITPQQQQRAQAQAKPEEGPKGLLSELEEVEHFADQLQDQMQVPSPLPMDGEEAAFQAAARALQQRLVTATRAEMDFNKVDLHNIYKPETTRNLRQSGTVLTDLTARRDGTLYGSAIWCFQVHPEAVREQSEQQPQAEREADSEPSQGPDAHELPYHRFSHRDALLLSLLKGQDENGEHVFVQADSQPVTVLEVRRNYLRIVASLQQSDLLHRAAPDVRWRMDMSSQEVSAERQIQAISLLDRPWDAAVDHAEAMEQYKRDRRYNPYEDPPPRQHGSVFSAMWTQGERRVRNILLGHPDSVRLAGTPPSWIERPAWRQDLKRHLHAKKGLNESQRAAIAGALISTFSLWQGPPGTGKTRTIHALVEALARTFGATAGRRKELGPILVCADTNAATDNIVEGVVAAGIDIVRLGQAAKVREEVRGTTLEARARETETGQKGVSMQEMASRFLEELRSSEKDENGKARQFSKQEKDRRKLERQRAQQLFDEGMKTVEVAENSVLRNTQVVAATLSGAGDMHRLGTRRFKVVVLDEASQATEPSTLIPLMRGAECVVMAGDPQQLPPTVVSKVALECDLHRTTFDRMQSSDLTPSLLDTQYRMHPQIAELPSQLFYSGRIKTGITASDRPLPQGLPWPNPQCPVVMVECEHGREERSAFGNSSSGSSFFNEEEAKLAIRACEALMAASDSKTAAILTPYNAQLRFINGLLRRSSRLKQVTVSTVDGYQGREADVIVFSAVRNNLEGQIGFVRDPRRLNVAITRPRRGLIVVGSPATLSSDPNWQSWIHWVQDHGCFLSPNALPHSHIEQDQALLKRARRQLPMGPRARRIPNRRQMQRFKDDIDW